MAQFLKAEITGLEEQFRRLRNVEQKARKTILRDAVNEGGKIVLAAAKAAAPVSDSAKEPELVSGLLKASLGKKVKVYPQSGVAIAIIGPQAKMARTKRTRERKLTGFGKRAAKLAAKVGGKKAQQQNPTAYAHLAGPGRKQRFMTEASQSTIDQARQVIGDKISEGIAEAWKL